MHLTVIAHNIRSTHNIGSIFRTCEGFGVETLHLTGYSPYPRLQNDTRLPHLSRKLDVQIHKTALGAERLIPFSYTADIKALLLELISKDYSIIGLEQRPDATKLSDFRTPETCALVLGEEVDGIPKAVQLLCDTFIEIPMHGQKESFNVAVATGIALYALTSR